MSRSLPEAVPGRVDVLVVDHYGRDASFERACRTFAHGFLSSTMPPAAITIATCCSMRPREARRAMRDMCPLRRAYWPGLPMHLCGDLSCTSQYGPGAA